MITLPLAIGLSCAYAGADPLVPTLSGAERDPTKIGVQGVEIHLPWEGAGHVTRSAEKFAIKSDPIPSD